MKVLDLLYELPSRNIVQYYWGGSYSICLTVSECIRRFEKAAPTVYEVDGTPEVKGTTGVLLFYVKETEGGESDESIRYVHGLPDRRSS